jgi:hypothetical protein
MSSGKGGIFESWAESILEHLFGEAPSKLLGEHVSSGLGAILIMILAAAGASWAWVIFVRAAEPRWEQINPDDPKAVEEAFNDQHVVAALAHRLGEFQANTVADFRAQLQKLDLYGKVDVCDRLMDRLDTSDEQLMRKLYSRRRTVKDLARKTGGRPARTLDEFKEQIRQLRPAWDARNAARPRSGQALPY